MDETQRMKLASIKFEIERGEYRIDERAVADAIMRRLRESPPGWGTQQANGSVTVWPSSAAGGGVCVSAGRGRTVAGLRAPWRACARRPRGESG